MDDVSPPQASLPPPGPEGSPAEPSHAPDITARDVSSAPASLDSADWAERPWPTGAGERTGGFQVLFRRSALNAIYAHGRSSAEVEICGVLVGDVYRDDAGPFLLIDAIVRGDHAGSANAQVTFTAETWNHIQRVMEAEHPDRRIVGWYHTHPNFGIFLSDMDLFIHGNFFNMPWQVAFVYDPVTGDEGVFVWRDGKTERAAFNVEEDVEKEIPTIAVSAEITAAALADFSRRLQSIERRQRTARVLQVLFLIVALAWPFILFTVARDQLARFGRMATTLPAAAGPADLAGGPVTPTPKAPLTAVVVLPPTTVPTFTATQPAIAIGTTMPAAAAGPATTQASATQPAAATNAVAAPPPPVTQPSNPPHDAEAPQVIRPIPTSDGAKVLEGPDEGKP
jgi:proteasome lid subunit RPN8/RPN11